jgi:hypothetical protein
MIQLDFGEGQGLMLPIPPLELFDGEDGFMRFFMEQILGIVPRQPNDRSRRSRS